MRNIRKLDQDETFARELRQAVQDQREINKLTNNLDEFKNKYGDRLREGEFSKLESGEQFRKTKSTPPSKKSKLDQKKAMAWFTDAMREKRVSRKEFNAIAIDNKGRKASLIIEMK